MLNHYETVFITTPVLSEQQIKEAVEKFKIPSPIMVVRLNMRKLGDFASWLIRSRKRRPDSIICYSLKQKVHWLTNWKPLTDVTRELFVF